MAKRGRKPIERIEIYGGSCKGFCDSSIYYTKENNMVTFTDIRTLVDFKKYKEIEICEDFTDANIPALERYIRYQTAKKFDVDCSYSTRGKYSFKVMMDLYSVLWKSDLPSAETLISANSALIRWCPDVPKKPGNPKKYPSVNWNKMREASCKYKEEIEQFLFRIATIGNYMPVPKDEQALLKNLGERFDKELRLIRAYFNPTDSLDMRDIFDEGIIEWLDRFCQDPPKRNNLGWENFVNKNYLMGSFVDENYDVIEFNGELSQLSQMIYNRSEVMIQEYERRVGM